MAALLALALLVVYVVTARTQPPRPAGMPVPGDRLRRIKTRGTKMPELGACVLSWYRAAYGGARHWKN
jgi:hypothetical protein